MRARGSLLAGVVSLCVLAGGLVWGGAPALAAVAPEAVTGGASGVSSSAVTLAGVVNPGGELLTGCQFEYGLEESYGASVPCSQSLEEIGGEESPVALTAQLTGLEPNQTYHYRLSVSNEVGSSQGQDQTFATPAAAPLVEAESVTALGSGSVTLQGQVNPQGAVSTYRFEYGPTASYGHSAPVPDGDLGAGPAGRLVSINLTGLSADSVYHYRIRAQNQAGSTQGPDQIFHTYTAPLAGLPDGRVYELVSPLEKNGYAAGAADSLHSAYSIAAAGGDGLFYTYQQGALENAVSGVDSMSVARRSATGWSSTPAAPRALGTLNLGSVPAIFEPSADLSRLLFISSESYAPGNPVTQKESWSVYLAKENSLEAWVGRPTILDPDPALGHLLGRKITIAGASSDLSTAYFGYYGTLVPADASREAVLQEHGGANNDPYAWGFYEFHDGVLSNAGVLPADSPLHPGLPDPYGAFPAAVAFTENLQDTITNQFDNQVSMDGSRAFFVSPAPEQCHYLGCGGETPQLYVRVTDPDGSQRTELVSRSVLGGGVALAPTGPLGIEAAAGYAAVHSFVFASPDGSRAFFESTDRLTEDAPADASVKTYGFDVDTQVLTYLPGVRGSIVTSTPDGSSFLFAKSPAQGTGFTGLALWRGPGGGQVTPVSSWPARGAQSGVARASVDGSVFVFDDGSEVYRYDVGSARLSCLSCAPAGVVSVGGASLSNVDFALGVAGVSQLPLDSRGVSSDLGRVFFDTPDALVAQDANGRRDVYEWEAQGKGSCARTDGCVFLISSGTDLENSFFLDNSASGDDVFFTTADGLVAGDADGGYDVYDARVDGGFQGGGASPCVGDACQGALGAAPLLGGAGSESFSGPGNPPPSSGRAVAVKVKPKKAKACRRGYARKHGKCVKGRPHKRARKAHKAARAQRAARPARRSGGGGK